MASIEASMMVSYSALSQELEQRKREIDRLRQELEEKTELVECLKTSLKESEEKNESLEEELKCAKEMCAARGVMISDLKSKLIERNRENERQASDYSLLLREYRVARQELAAQREDPPARQHSAPTSLTSQPPASLIPPAPEFSKEREDKFKSCTKEHSDEHKVITGEEYSKLRAPIGFNCTKEEKARFFYFEVLDTKGEKAYTLLHHCLKLEEDHLGHRDLVKLLDKDTQQTGEQLQDRHL